VLLTIPTITIKRLFNVNASCTEKSFFVDLVNDFNLANALVFRNAVKTKQLIYCYSSL